jgi:Helix-turn-helix domain of resolvase
VCRAAVAGRPRRFPFCRAWAKPARTRSRRISRSNSAFCGSSQNAEVERSLIVERTQAGMKEARRRGVKFGRKKKLTPAQIAKARKLIEAGERVEDVAGLWNVGRTTFTGRLPCNHSA